MIQIFPTSVAASLPTTSTEHLWKCDATAAAFAVTMPDATRCKGGKITLIKTDAGANAVTINPAGAQRFLGTGGAAQASLSLATIGKAFTLVPDGSNWVIVGAV